MPKAGGAVGSLMQQSDSLGSEFHSFGPATENARRPYVASR